MTSPTFRPQFLVSHSHTKHVCRHYVHRALSGGSLSPFRGRSDGVRISKTSICAVPDGAPPQEEDIVSVFHEATGPLLGKLQEVDQRRFVVVTCNMTLCVPSQFPQRTEWRSYVDKSSKPTHRVVLCLKISDRKCGVKVWPGIVCMCIPTLFTSEQMIRIYKRSEKGIVRRMLAKAEQQGAPNPASRSCNCMYLSLIRRRVVLPSHSIGTRANVDNQGTSGLHRCRRRRIGYGIRLRFRCVHAFTRHFRCAY